MAFSSRLDFGSRPKLDFVEMKCRMDDSSPVAQEIMANPSPSVSVIIPTFNRASTIGKAIASVVSQTFQDFELIVIDDGSTDETADVLLSFANTIRLIRQENRGVSAARNAGIRAARGRWIAFLDSDDEWHRDKLALQVACLDEYSV